MIKFLILPVFQEQNKNPTSIDFFTKIVIAKLDHSNISTGLSIAIRLVFSFNKDSYMLYNRNFRVY